MSDHKLLEGLRGGSHDAFNSIFRTYYAQLVSVAERLVRERALAEEIVQDTMLELWRRREALALDTSLRAYLIRATRNRALNHLRHARVEREAAPLLATETTTAPTGHLRLVEDEINAVLQQAVHALPDRCREVFELSRVHGLKYAEIADALGISIKTVEAQMGKALRVLRDRLEPWLPKKGPS